jgi:hypothetical protein
MARTARRRFSAKNRRRLVGWNSYRFSQSKIESTNPRSASRGVFRRR